MSPLRDIYPGVVAFPFSFFKAALSGHPFKIQTCLWTFWIITNSIRLELGLVDFYCSFFSWKSRRPSYWPLVSSWEGVTLPKCFWLGNTWNARLPSGLFLVFWEWLPSCFLNFCFQTQGIGVVRNNPKGFSCCWNNSQRCPEWLLNLFLFGIR